MRYLIMLILFFIACNNKQIADKKTRTDFFETEADAFKKVQNAIQKINNKEQLIRIDNITYIDGSKKTYAIVFFQSNMGSSNLAFEKTNNSTNDAGVTSIKCTGQYCDCKVHTTISREGDVAVKCSCQSCTMEIRQY